MTSIKVNQELQAQLVIKQQILTYKQKYDNWGEISFVRSIMLFK